MIISFIPCDSCNKLVLVGKLKLQDNKYYCMDCFNEKQNKIVQQNNVDKEKAVRKNAK